MGVLTPLRRRMASRCLVLYRAQPTALADTIRAGFRLHIQRGHAWVGLCFTEVEGVTGKLLGSAPQELAAFIAVQSAADERPSAWIPHRAMASRLGAALTERLTGTGACMGVFSRSECPHRFELSVTSKGREELYLRAESSSELKGSAFLSSRELESFLRKCGPMLPSNPWLPEAESLDHNSVDWAIDPLCIFELRQTLLAEILPAQSVELDCALRYTRLARSKIAAAVESGPDASIPYVPV